MDRAVLGVFWGCFGGVFGAFCAHVVHRGRNMPKMGVLDVVLHLNMSLRDGKMEWIYSQTGKDVQKT